MYLKLDDLLVTDVYNFLLNYERRLECSAHLKDVIVSPLANVASKQIGKSGNSHQSIILVGIIIVTLVVVLVDIIVDITIMPTTIIDPDLV